MSERIFKSLIADWAERDWESYADAPKFITSKKHNRAMKKIFKLYERNTRRLRPQAEIRVRVIQRRIAVVLMVIILAVITGFTAAYFISRSFRGEVHNDNTYLLPIDMENCPMVIEDEYYLSEVPEEFEIVNTSSTPFRIATIYQNKQTYQTITFEQYIKPGFDPVHFNTEKGELVEIEINGYSGVLLELNIDHHNLTQVIWDNGDYILEITGDLTKEGVINLAKSAKVFENAYN